MLCHLVRSSVSNLVKAIQVDLQLIVVVFFVERLSFDAVDSHFYQDYCLGAISESKGGFSCRGSHCSPVCPQDIGQFLRPCSLNIVQPNFDDLEQCPVRYLRLSISLWVSWGWELVLDP